MTVRMHSYLEIEALRLVPSVEAPGGFSSRTFAEEDSNSSLQHLDTTPIRLNSSRITLGSLEEVHLGSVAVLGLQI